MRYAFGINFEGKAALQPEKDGGRLLGFSGSGEPPESTDQWQLTMHAPPTATDRPSEPVALVLISPVGDRIDAVLATEGVDAITDGSGSVQGERVDLRFAVTGGTGGYAGANGSIRLHGTLLPQGSLLTADFEMETGPDAWRPPDARPLSAAEDAAGGSHVGPQPRTQRKAEREAEQELVRRARRQSG